MAILKNTNITTSGFLKVAVGTEAQKPASPQPGMMRRNSTTGFLEVYNGTSWRRILEKRNIILGSTASNPAENAMQILAAYPNAPSGLYWIRPTGWGGAAQQVYCDMDWHGGGWILVASNNAGDTTIPAGNSRRNQIYELDRTGALGTPSPNSDYIIGSIINNIIFRSARIFAFGGITHTDAAWQWPTNGNAGNLGVSGAWVWDIPSSVTGVNRLTTPVARWDGVRCYGSTSDLARYFLLDGVKADRINGGYSANDNQTTIGGVGVQGSSGDPTTGCYVGHGSTEGNAGASYEGWYPLNNVVFDCRGYTTWVR
jgi:hypothetical protein